MIYVASYKQSEAARPSPCSAVSTRRYSETVPLASLGLPDLQHRPDSGRSLNVIAADSVGSSARAVVGTRAAGHSGDCRALVDEGVRNEQIVGFARLDTMGQAPSSEIELQEPLNTTQLLGAYPEGHALATQQWESQMKAKQRDLLQRMEDFVKEGKQCSFPHVLCGVL